MKKIFLIFFVALFIFNSCGNEDPIKDPSFCFNLVITNSARSLKLSLDIRPSQTLNSTGMIYIHRIGGHSPSLDYREHGAVRRHLLDTMLLNQKTFEKFSRLVRQSAVLEQKDIFGTRTDGNVYQIHITDSLRQNIFSMMGQTENRPLLELIAFCFGQFEEQFPAIPVMDFNSEIVVKKFDRVSAKQDSAFIRLIKKDYDITLYRGHAVSDPLTADTYVELWRTLENNRVWDLKSNREFISKYPIEYHLLVKCGDRMNEFVVYAPSKLKDKRYFNVINHIEALTTLK